MIKQNKNTIHSSFWSNLFKNKTHDSEVINILGKIPPFSELGRKDILNLYKLLHNRNYIAGEYIFYQGDPGIGLYLIEEGSVEIQRMDESGNLFPLAMLTKGDFFGELAMIDGAKRSASAIARSDSKLVVLFKPDLDEYVKKYPAKGVKVLQGFSLIIISRLRKLNEDYFYIQKEKKREKIHGTEY